MNENDKIDQAAQEQEDHESMVESTVDRQIFADNVEAEAAFQRLDAAVRKRKASEA